MKKLLLASAAIVGMTAITSPALAGDGISLDIGGHLKGYVTYIDQDSRLNNEERSFDILRETEIHLNGETTLDNGLTVGVNFEADADGADSFELDESYAYLSGSWGRINFGEEDGAAYLLQVAAPSADSNYDGIRQFVTPINVTLSNLNDGNNANFITVHSGGEGFDYDNDLTRNAEKLTYLSPVMNGFQLGLSYTPDVADTNAAIDAQFASNTNTIGGVNQDDDGGYGSAWEGAVRYEGQMDEIGYTVGAGYANVDLENSAAGFDDYKEWNAGVDLDWSAFGLGVVYTENNNGQSGTQDENETWVVGADYTTGPYKLGASWLNNDSNVDAATPVETNRLTGGIVYTYGPGMTFRGSVSYIEAEREGQTDVDATHLLVGTQINF
ncbi:MULTISPECIES: porin [Spongiibacteraceae]|uniref:Porin domain-containing protein n=1 Tax=Zhongshania aliphaticivorans TaxID=1470434 RepID=A0A127M285_9GAMM|nr:MULTISPECIES: porin [Spongiibacteraceae]AMO67339.1 hypothetical protein AZF00_03045 [Zhongshania aliphaticivorans]MBM7422314.1 hypothetical protein [Spongiibacter marinus]